MITLFLRSLAFNIAFFGWTTFIVIRAMPGFFLGRRPILRAANLWGRGVNWLLKVLCRIHVEIRGRDHLPTDRPVIVAAKHQSTWETTNIEYLVPDCAIILKRELTLIPFFGQLLLKSGMISVHRQKGQSILPQIVQGALRCQKEGRSLLIFPEGTRRAPDAPPRYRYGIFPIYQALNVPVIPAAHNAGYFWGRRQFLKRPGTIVLEFLPAIEPGLGEKPFFTALEQRIEDACARLKPIVTGVSEVPPAKGGSLWRRVVLVVSILGIIYGAAWYGGARYIAHQASSYVTGLKERGVPIVLDRATPTIGGFPGAVQLHWGAGHVSIMDGTLTGDDVTSVHPLYPLGAVTIRMTHGAIHHGGMSWGKAASLTADLSTTSDDPSGVPGYRLDMTAMDIATPIPGFDPILGARLVMTWPFDLMPPVTHDKAKAFYTRGGTVEVHHLALSTDAPSLQGSGTLALDEDLQPMAAFAVDITHVDHVLKVLQKNRWISAAEAALASLPLAFFAADDGARHRLSITLQDRQLSLGPIPLVMMRPISWPPS